MHDWNEVILAVAYAAIALVHILAFICSHIRANHGNAPS